MMRMFVEGIGIFAPGLIGWEQARAVLAETASYVPGELPRLQPSILAPDMRRRASVHVRLAVEVAAQAVAHANRDPESLASVFVSSEADGETTHYICEEVSRPAPQVSPTKFHNSVNNTAAGYFSMAVGSSMPSTSIVCWDRGVAAGLIEAAAQHSSGVDVLLVVDDLPMPPPLYEHHPFAAPFGAALVLTRERGPRTLASVSLTGEAVIGDATTSSDGALEKLRQGNPAAFLLPVLAAIAAQRRATVLLPYFDGRVLEIGVEP